VPPLPLKDRKKHCITKKNVILFFFHITLKEKQKYLVASPTPPNSSPSSPTAYGDKFIFTKDNQINQSTTNNFYTPVIVKNKKSHVETSAREETPTVNKPQKKSEFIVDSNSSAFEIPELNRDLPENYQMNYTHISPASQLPLEDVIKTKTKSRKFSDGLLKQTISNFGQNFKVFSKSKENKEYKENKESSNIDEENDYIYPSSNLLNTPLSVSSSASPSPLSSTSASSSTSSASTNPVNTHELNTPKSKTLPFPYKPVAYQFTDNNSFDQNTATTKQNVPTYNLPKTPPPQVEELNGAQKNRKSFKKLVQQIVDSDILSLKNANSVTPDSDLKHSGSSSSTCTTPTSSSSQSTTTTTIKTSPKLGRNLVFSKETTNSFDMDFNSNLYLKNNAYNNNLNVNNNNNNNKSKQNRNSTLTNYNETNLVLADNSEQKSNVALKKPSELYLNDKSLYKKDPGSVCEFLFNKLNQQETHSSNKPSNAKIIENQARFSSIKQTDLREKNPPLKAELYEASNFIDETLESSLVPPVAPVRNKIKRAIPVNDDLKRIYNNEAIKQAEAIADLADRQKKYQNENEVVPSSSSSPSSSSAASPHSYKKDQNSTEPSHTANNKTQAKVVYKLDFPIVNHYDNNLDTYKTPQPTKPNIYHNHNNHYLEPKNNQSKNSNRNGMYIDFDSQDAYELNSKKVEETQQAKKASNQEFVS
jgi:hypothetical protein